MHCLVDAAVVDDADQTNFAFFVFRKATDRPARARAREQRADFVPRDESENVAEHGALPSEARSGSIPAFLLTAAERQAVP